MLGRLEQSFAAQRSFSAQVSHELRTPIAIARSEADVLLAGGPSDAVRTSAESVRRAMIRADRTIAALLALARAVGGGSRHDELALDDLVGTSIAEILEGDEFADIQVDLELHPTPLRGDVALLDSITRNLIDNAARHNRPGGWIRVRVAVDGASDDRRAVLEVVNSTSVSEIAVPKDATSPSGIGLTVVAAAVAAQDGTLTRDMSDPDTCITRVELPVDATRVRSNSNL